MHKKYTYKNGKKFGPYYYETKRVNGRVITTYLGNSLPDKQNKSYLLRSILIFSAFAVLILLFYLFSFNITGNVSLDLNANYDVGEQITGKLELNLKRGELIPVDSVLAVSYGNSSKEFILSDLVSDEKINGLFYAEGVALSGEGEGYGLPEFIYPTIDFEISIIEDDGSESPSSSSESSEVVNEDVVTEEPSNEESVPEESSNNAEESSSQESSSESSESSLSESSSSEPSSESSDSGDAGITGAVISDSNIVSGSVSKDNEFSYDLRDNENVVLVEGSVYYNGEKIDDSFINIDVEDGRVVITTDYSVENSEDSLILSIDVSDFELTAVSDDVLSISLNYKDEIIVEASEDISISENVEEPSSTSESSEEPESNVTGTTEIIEVIGNMTGDNRTESNNTITNRSIVNDTLIEVSTKQFNAVIGQPVKWIKTISVNTSDNLSLVVEIPASAEDVVVIKKDKAVEDDISEDVDFTIGITGEVTADFVGENIFSKILKRFGITGRVVSDLEVQEIPIEVSENDNVVEVEYYTDAPTASETELIDGVKTVFVSSPEDVHYTDVLVFTNIPDEFGLKDKSVIVEWVENSTSLDFTISDINNDGNYDYIEWVAPHLSNQTFNIILIIDAMHLDENRNYISNIYNETYALDNVWSETITDGHYVRVRFERNLTSDRDITIYPRIVSGNPVVNVYEKDENDLIAEFNPLIDNSRNRVILSNLVGEQDTFDLQILNGNVEFDYITDPVEVAFFDDFETDLTKWDGNGATAWDLSTAQAHDGAQSLQASNNNEGDIITDDIDTSSATAINVSFWFRDDDLDGGDIDLYFYDGAAYDAQTENLEGLTEDTWLFTSFYLTDSQYFKSNFRIRFNAVLGSGETFWVDGIFVNITTATPAQDNEYPVFSNFQDNPANNSVYSFGAVYRFNSTISSTNGTTWIRFDNSNYTARNSSTVFNTSISGLSAGNHFYNWSSYGNGTNKNFNISGTRHYFISKATTSGSISGTASINFGTAGDATGSESNSGDGDVTYTLYRNNISVSNPDTTSLGVGTWRYHYNSTTGTNYTASSSLDTFDLTVSQVSSVVNLTFDGVEGNKSVSAGNSVLLNGTRISGDSSGRILLYNDGTLINNATTEASNLTVFSTEGLFNITVYYQGSQNYSLSSETYYVTVTPAADTTPPGVTINFPSNETYHASYDLPFEYNVSLNENGSVMFTLDDGVTNKTMVGNQGLFGTSFNSSNDTIADGNYLFRVYANDTSGNINYTETINFTLITENIVVNSTVTDSSGDSVNSTILIYDEVNTEYVYNYTGENQSQILPLNVTYRIDLYPLDIESIDRIRFRKVNFSEVGERDISIFSIDERTDIGNFSKVFSVDPLMDSFDNATVTFTAEANSLYKCQDWNFTAQTCFGNWTLYMRDLIPGQTYNFTLFPGDPGYGIINITNATHLDENKSFISNIYDEVYLLDDIWSETIPDGHYIRVIFEKNLTNENDITIYSRNVSGDPVVNVYEVNNNTLLEQFNNLADQQYYTIYLTNLTGEQDTFDLQVVGGDLEFDHIVDPSIALNGNASDVALAPLGNEKFVLVYVNNTGNSIQFMIKNTNGTNLVGPVTVATGSGNGYNRTNYNVTRVGVAVVNTTSFVVGWTNTSAEWRAGFTTLGTYYFSPATSDGSIGTTFHDISLTAFNSTLIAYCYADTAEGDHDMRRFSAIDGALVGAETDINTAMTPETNLNNIQDCVAVNETTIAAFEYHATTSDDATYHLVNHAGTEVLTDTDIDTAVGTGAQVAVTSLDSNKYVLAWYDQADQDITISINRTFATSLLPVTDIDTAAGTTSRLAIATVRNISTDLDNFVVVYYNQTGTDIVARFYNGSGTVLRPPLIVESNPSTTPFVMSAVGRNSATGLSLCDETWIVAYTNITGRSNIKTYWLNGSEWDGNCPVADTIPPEVTINSPSNSSLFAPILFNVTTDEDASFANYTLTNGVVNYTMQNNGNIDFNATNSSIALGQYTAKFFVWDTAGNLNSTTNVTFSVVDSYSVNSCIEINTANSLYAQTANIVPDGSTASCINVTAQNVTYDCSGFSIVNSSYDGNLFYVSQNNFTLRNCGNLSSNNGPSSVATIRLQGVNNSSLSNITLYRCGSSCIELQSGQNNNFTNINLVISANPFVSDGGITVTASSYNNFTNINSYAGNGIIFSGVSNFNRVRSSLFNGSSSYGVSLSSASNNLIEYVNITNTDQASGIVIGTSFQSENHNVFNNVRVENSTARGIYFSGGFGNNQILNTTFNNTVVIGTNVSHRSFETAGDSLDFSPTKFVDSYIENYTISGAGSGGTIIVENTQYGMIKFLSTVNGTGTNFSRDIFVGSNNASVRSDLNIGFNKSANVSLYNVQAFSEPVILRDGVECSSAICRNLTALEGNVTFNVTGWTEYRIASNATDSNNAPYNGTSLIINSTLGLNRTLEDLNIRTTLLDVNNNTMNVTVRWYNHSILHLIQEYNSSYSNGTTFIGTLDDRNTTKGDNWTVGLTIHDGEDSFSVNSSNLTILNSLPNVSLISPANGSVTINRTSQTFTWVSSDDDGDSIVSDRINISLLATSVCTDTRYGGSQIYTPGSPSSTSLTEIGFPLNCLVDNGDSYLWSVSASDDGSTYGNYAGPFNLSLQAYLNVVMNISAVEFGSLTYLYSNDTSDNSPQPIIIINQGNVLKSIFATATSLWRSVSNPSSYFQFKFANVTTNGISENGSFNWANSNTTYINFPDYSEPASGSHLYDFNYSDNTDSVEVDINVTVPPTEGPGFRNTTILFTIELGAGDTYE